MVQEDLKLSLPSPESTVNMAGMLQALLYGVEDARIETTSIPPLPDDGVLVRIEAVGICGSDVHMFHGIDPWGALSSYPAGFGHETAGVVVRRGRNVRDVEMGDRVAIKPMYLHACLKCDACRAGFTNDCAHLGMWHGRHRGAGGFAEFEVVAESNLYRVNPELPAETAALTDVYACAIHALHHLPAGSKTAAIVGTGPIAVSLAQVCRWAGLHVTVLGRNPKRLAAILQAGIAHTVMDIKSAESNRESTGFERGVDVAFECVGGRASEALNVAASAVAPRGWLGVMGAFADRVELAYQEAYRKEMTITFLNGYCSVNGDDFEKAAQLLSVGEIHAEVLISHRFPLRRFAEAMRTAVDRPEATMKVMVQP